MTFVSFLYKYFSHPKVLSRKQLVTCSTHNSLGTFRNSLLNLHMRSHQCPDVIIINVVGMHLKTQHF